MGCEDKIMYLISEIACLGSLMQNLINRFKDAMEFIPIPYFLDCVFKFDNLPVGGPITISFHTYNGGGETGIRLHFARHLDRVGVDHFVQRWNGGQEPIQRLSFIITPSYFFFLFLIMTIPGGEVIYIIKKRTGGERLLGDC